MVCEVCGLGPWDKGYVGVGREIDHTTGDSGVQRHPFFRREFVGKPAEQICHAVEIQLSCKYYRSFVWVLGEEGGFLVGLS